MPAAEAARKGAFERRFEEAGEKFSEALTELSAVLPAATPIVLNLILIASLIGPARAFDPAHAQAWAVTVAGVAQFLWLAWSLRQSGLSLSRPRPRLTPEVRQLFRLMGPAVVGSAPGSVGGMSTSSGMGPGATSGARMPLPSASWSLTMTYDVTVVEDTRGGAEAGGIVKLGWTRNGSSSGLVCSACASAASGGPPGGSASGEASTSTSVTPARDVAGATRGASTEVSDSSSSSSPSIIGETVAVP
jgi:hypothetical protein